jgi:hypothetical protein
VYLKPWLEGLENRRVPSTITWNTTAHPTGGDWDSASSWNGGVVPGPADTASITGLTSPGTVYLDSGNADSVNSLVTDSTTTLEVIDGSLSLGIATSSTFGGTVFVSLGASLNVGAGSTVEIGAGQTLTDNGTVSFASGDAVTFNVSSNSSQSIQVNGDLTANATTFNDDNADGSSVIDINSGGSLKATGSTFNLNYLSLNNSAVYESGDLTDDVFDQPIYVPYGDVRYLSDNAKFETININNATLSSGTLDLNVIGTDASSLSYAFPSGFTVATGATLAVEANVPVYIGTGQTLADDGMVSFASGDTVTFNVSSDSSQSIQVNGDLTAEGTTFNDDNSNGSSFIDINSGGKLKATGSSFSLTSLSINNGAVYESDDLTDDVFDLPIYVPYDDVRYLSNNTSFQTININGATLSSGTLDLNAIGTNTDSLSYAFPFGFTVASGATLAVGPNVPLSIAASQTITDNGTLSFGAGDNVTVDGAVQIMAGGTLTANSASFAGGSGDMTVNSGGNLTLTRTTFDIPSLTLNSGSTDTLYIVAFSGLLNINSGANVGTLANPTITGDDFSAVGDDGIIASGGSAAQIPFSGNYWGTSVPTAIQAKIEDSFSNPSLPTVVFQPVGYTSGTVASATSVTYSPSDQVVTLSATVSDSAAVAVNEGMETFTVLNGGAVIGSQVTVRVVNGAASASYTLPGGTLPGQYTIEAEYSDSGGEFQPTVDSSHSLTVNPAVAYQLVIETPPSSTATAGQAFATQPVIYEEDKYGNLETGDNTTVVTAVIGEGSGPLLGTVSVTVVGGVAVFTDLYDDTAETITLKFTSNTLVTATSGGIVVTPGAASKVVFGQQPTNTTAGVPISPAVTVRVEDEFGNLVTTDTSTVTLSLSSETIEAGATAVASGGVATFSGLTIGVPGTYTLAATDSTLTPSGASTSFTIEPPPTHVVIAQQPSNVIAGAAINPAVTVDVDDSSNDIVPTDSSIVTLTLSNGTFAGGSHAVMAHAVDGIATFSGLEIDATGSYTLTASDGVLAPSNPSGSFTVLPAAAAKLVLVVPPYTAVVAGNPLTDPVVMDEVDQYGNVVTTDNTTVVTVALASGTGTLLGTPTAQVIAGVASFNYLENNTAGPKTLQFSAPGLPPVVSPPSIVAPAAASGLTIVTRPPGGVVTGKSLTVVVNAIDPYDNVATSYNGPVTLSAAGGTLSGTLTVTASDGVATFNDVIPTTTGSLSLSAISASLTPASSTSISVAPGSPPPTVEAIVVLAQKTNAKGKPVGKKTFAGFEFDFSTAMNPLTLANLNNFELDTYKSVTVKVGKKKHKGLEPTRISFTLSAYNATNNSVRMIPVGQQKFKLGGTITLLASAPGQISGSNGILLDGDNVGSAGDDATFTITKNAKNIIHE